MNNKKIDSGKYLERIELNGIHEETLIFNQNSNITMKLELTGQGELKLNIILKDHSNVNLLILNHSDESIDIIENARLHDKTHLNLNYGELSSGEHIKKTELRLIGEDSRCVVNGAILSSKSLKWEIHCLHQAKNSYAEVNQHGIVMESGFLFLNIVGEIEKGNARSETHQNTKILSFGKRLKTIVDPQLLIDENDVAASHAASVGQVNQEHLYYLKARGLSHDEAMQLMILGYLKPVLNGIDDEKIKRELDEEIERRVLETWKK